MFSRLMVHVFEDDEMIIRPKAKAPQEIEQVEFKGESELVRDVVHETKGYEDDENAYDIARQ